MIELVVSSENLEQMLELLLLLEEAGQEVALSDDLGRFWSDGGRIEAGMVLRMRPWDKTGANYRLRYDPQVLARIQGSSSAVRRLEREAAEAERGMRQTALDFQIRQRRK